MERQGSGIGEQGIGGQGLRAGIRGNNRGQTSWRWTRDGFGGNVDICKECLLKLELPLLDSEARNLGTLWLVKQIKGTGK